MVRELTELQGTMGGIYAREDGRPEEVWKAIYYHYLPVGVEADAPPTREQLGKAAVTWAAVSLADKLDTVTSMFAAGERPTGSRDPYGLRRAAQGLVRILVDLPELTGLDRGLRFAMLLDQAASAFEGDAAEWRRRSSRSCSTACASCSSSAATTSRNVRAVTHGDARRAQRRCMPARKLETLPEFTETADFKQLAGVFKRVRNIAQDPDHEFDVCARRRHHRAGD